MQVLYDWFGKVLRLDRQSQGRSESSPNMADADNADDMNIDQEGEIVDYGDSPLGTLGDLSEEPAHDEAGTQITPAQVSGQVEQSAPSQGAGLLS